VSEFRFAEPHWIHALWAVFAFGLLLAASERSSGKALERLVAPALLSRLVTRATPGQRRTRIALLTLSAVFGVLALMRPQWGLEFIATPRASAELMVAVDVSRSMLAEDVVPNRLERAKAEVRDLLSFLEGDHVGLIAFAGRASVLAPLTPDFGFFRLVLDELGPHSVTRGGTRLEEPIRRAVAGFRATGDTSRAILLITDGEDLDSFPLDAAREAGSLVRNPDGQTVRSRLDDETLREIARLTGGAYVPAGTGALDLESIYRAHIAGLMRGQLDGAGRSVRTEGFQWLVLASLLCVIGAALVGRARQVAVAVLAGALLSSPGTLWAQDASDEQEPAVEEGEQVEEPAAPEPAAEPSSPREAYNLALEELQAQELGEAERLFEMVRTTAGTDGEARYRATYGLGWAAAASADARLEEEPADALSQLILAADRFRDSLRLRPGSEDARHNLEVVLKRARILEDSLRERDATSLADSLDELSQRQRELVGAVRSTVEVPGAAAQTQEESLRARLRDLSSGQRLILSDGNILAGRADAERSKIESSPEEERQPEDQMRAAQLGQLLHYLQRARERMGHTRRELRQRRPGRAHRRASVALAELKRARDQLRDPVEVLDVLIRDSLEVAQYTELYARTGVALPDGSERKRPDWLSLGYLGDALDGVGERTGELRARLGAGLAQGSAVSAADLDPGSQRLLANIQEAVPLVEAAALGFGTARGAITRDAAVAAVVAEREAVAALQAARELFLDLRGLIETAYADQHTLGGLLTPGTSGAGPAPSEIAPQLWAAQRRNLARTGRISGLMDEELALLPAQAPSQDAASQRERFQLGKRLLTFTQNAMQGVMKSLRGPRAGAPPSLEGAERWNVRALQSLEELRRLFFSIVEHLRDTARRQQALNDATEQAVALADPTPALGPLIPRQAQLAEIAGSLAAALEEQSRQEQGQPPSGPQGGLSPEVQQEMLDRLRRAAELTLAAQDPMRSAAEGLAAEQFEDARGNQDRGLGHLLEAVALLTPPEAQEGEQDQGGEDQRGDADEGAREEQRQVADPSQLLQEVRDREARRRRERSRAQRGSYDTVEKDW
jgi:Ca-activated chloride channel family protein